jgi:hypothetical protein
MTAITALLRADTFTAQIYIGGSLEQAKQVCREYCAEVGFCVTVEPVSFIYTGGEEVGVRVGMINYPRFPRTPHEIMGHAETLAERLRVRLCQGSFSIVTPTETLFKSWRKKDEMPPMPDLLAEAR